MVDARSAVASARKYFSELSGRSALDLSVEEVEHDTNERIWKVTLGYIVNAFSGSKDFKLFEIDDQTEEVISMKIR